MVVGKKHKEFGSSMNILRLSFVQTFSSLALASITTIWSLYLFGFLGSDSKVALVSGLFSLISFISFFVVIPLIEKNDKSKLYVYSLFLVAISYFFMSFVRTFWIFFIISIAIVVFQTLRISSYGILVKENSKKRELNSNEGLIFTFLNLGWLLGPLIAGFVLSLFNFSGVFILSSVFFLIAMILFETSSFKDKFIKKNSEFDFLKNFKRFFKDRQRLISYGLATGVGIWWSLVYIFMPLMIVEKGLSRLFVGYFFFAVVMPLVIFEYPFSSLILKKGYGFLFRLGFFVAFLIALFCFFIPNIHIVLLLMILSSIGLALLEPTLESYFFSISLDKEINHFYGPYYTSKDFGGLIGRFIPAVLLIFFPSPALFLFFSAIMLIMFFLAFLVNN